MEGEEVAVLVVACAATRAWCGIHSIVIAEPIERERRKLFIVIGGLTGSGQIPGRSKGDRRCDGPSERHVGDATRRVLPGAPEGCCANGPWSGSDARRRPSPVGRRGPACRVQ
jgi:hypothetical protein